MLNNSSNMSKLSNLSSKNNLFTTNTNNNELSNNSSNNNKKQINKILIVYSNPLENKQVKSTYNTVINYYKNNDNNIDIAITDINSLDFNQDICISRQSTNKDTNSSNGNTLNNNNNNNNNIIQQEVDNQTNNLKIKEKNKVRASDLLLFIFPIMYNSCPAKLKYWFENIFEENFAYSLEKNRLYSTGLLKNKYASMICITEEDNSNYGVKGKYILSIEEIMEHISHGVLAFTGLSVLTPLYYFVNLENIKNYINKNELHINELIITNYLKDLNSLKAIYN